MKCLVLLPRGKVARGKVAQAVAAGARVVQIRGNFDAAMRLVRELSAKDKGVYLLNSINPFRLEGQKTIAFEIVEALGRMPDFVVLPVGNAGNISALWKGFKEWAQLYRVNRLPRMIGIQAAGAAPLVRALSGDLYRPIEHPETVATAIRIGDPVNRAKAVRAIRESNGSAEMVTDREILGAQKRLAGEEGLFVEPAGAAPIAFLLRRPLPARSTVVCVATGHGLKDPDVMTQGVRFSEVPATLGALRRVIR
jgi:threonine synthase